MPMCQAGREVPEQSLITNRLVLEEAWGEVWRATHEKHGAVLFVAYTSLKGMELFQQALPQLERWQAGGGVSTESLLPILAISRDTAIPYVLVADPGGKTLREFAGDQEKIIDAADLAKWMIGPAQGVLSALNLNLTPVGITPDTVFYDGSRPDAPWRLMPVVPGVGAPGVLLGNGRYMAPDLAASNKPQFAHADTFSLAWMLAESIVQDFTLPRDPSLIETRLPAPKLVAHLKLLMRSQAGAYPEPAMFEAAIRRWHRAEADEDLKEWRKAQAKLRKTGRPGGVKPVGGKTAGKPINWAFWCSAVGGVILLGAIIFAFVAMLNK